MKKSKSLSASEFSHDDYANILVSLRNLITNDNKVDSQHSVLEQQKKLSTIFLKTKKEKMIDIFIQKMKRTISTNTPCLVKQRQTIKGPCGFLVHAIEFPEPLHHAIVFINVIVVIILIVLATFEGFIDNFGQFSVPVLVLKIFCLVINVVYFILKLSNKSFGTGQNLTYIHEVIRAYAVSGRLFLDFITILFQIFTLIFPQVMALSGVFFFFLIIGLVFCLADFVQLQAAYLHSQKSVLTWGLIKVCLSNVMFAHFMASIILAMGRINLEQNWMTRAGIEAQNWLVKYVYAFYWGTTIMMTVGFGDILPNTPQEVIITAFLEMTSCIVLGYNISEIGHLISTLRQKSQTLNRKLAIFDRMTKTEGQQKYNISSQLQNNIYTHLKQTNSGSNNLNFQQSKDLLNELPQHLRKGYNQEANQYIFSSILFFNRLKPTTVQMMAQKFQSKFYFSGANLIGSDQTLMVLQEGQIGFVYHRRGSALNGQIFDSVAAEKGKHNLLLNPEFLSLYQQKKYEMVAKKNSIVWEASIEDLKQCLKQSAIDFQYYFSLLHKHNMDEYQWNGVYCPRCSENNRVKCHVIFECPRIVYKPLQKIIIQRNVLATDLRTCRRKNFIRQRNKLSKTSSLIVKQSFNKLIQKMDIVKKNIGSILENQFEYSRGNINEIQLQDLQKILKTQQLSMDQIIDIFEKAIRRYETGYQEIFWELQVDQVHNYQFYFANHNANRLFGIHVPNINKKNPTFWNKRQYGTPTIFQDSNSILLPE